VIKADPAVSNVNAYTGGQGSSNGGFIFIALKRWRASKESLQCGVRRTTAPEIINRLRPS